MGLLDSLFGGMDQRTALSVLAQAGPSREPSSFGQRLFAGLMQADQMKAQDEERKAKLGLLGAQLEETKAQAAQREAAARQAQQQAARQMEFRQALRGMSPQQAMAGGGGPTPGNAAQIGAVNWDALARQFPDQVDLIQKLAGAKNFGREEVSNVEGVMPGTNMPATLFRNKFGDVTGQPIPKAVEMAMQDIGGSVVPVNKYAPPLSLAKTNSPDSLLSAQTAMRGQNMADARSREKNQIDRDSVGKVEWKQDVNGSWVGLPKEVSGKGPVTPVATTTPSKREQQAKNVLDILNEAEPLLKKATGSYIGAGADQVGRVFGGSTEGAATIAQLKALEGSLMMAQPRMEGPQSNLDVKLYSQMAGQIGDPTIPYGMKKRAVETIRRLNEKYAGQQEAKPSGASGSWDDDKEARYQRWKAGQQ